MKRGGKFLKCLKKVLVTITYPDNQGKSRYQWDARDETMVRGALFSRGKKSHGFWGIIYRERE
jgi:hypothetical protein